jgi:pimeloyl-ACP methyl ester carboxylesterase
MLQRRIILIHGLLGALDCLRCVESLITAAEAHTVHLIGYGDHRDAPTNGITLASQAAHAAKRIESLGWQKAWVLGHSVGGAITMFLADQRPDLVEGIINVEGNFSLKDAFWSSRIAKIPLERWMTQFEKMQSDPVAWLKSTGIEPSPQRIAWAETMLQREQPATTVHNMAHAVIAETSPPGYLEMIRRVIDRGAPLHLVAGEKSAANWSAPDWVRSTAASYSEIPKSGHMMMLEDPKGFTNVINEILAGW